MNNAINEIGTISFSFLPLDMLPQVCEMYLLLALLFIHLWLIQIGVEDGRNAICVSGHPRDAYKSFIEYPDKYD